MNKIKNKTWPILVTIITFLLAILFSFISQIATSSKDLLIPLLILISMLFISIIADGIAVAVTSCDINRLKYFAKKDKIIYNISITLVNNAEKVNNICADVIGDMCGILSGACGATLVAKSALTNPYISTVCVSSLIVALTVGGKAFLKNFAVNSAEDFVISVAKIMKLFIRKKNENIREH